MRTNEVTFSKSTGNTKLGECPSCLFLRRESFFAFTHLSFSFYIVINYRQLASALGYFFFFTFTIAAASIRSREHDNDDKKFQSWFLQQKNIYNKARLVMSDCYYVRERIGHIFFSAGEITRGNEKQ